MESILIVSQDATNKIPLLCINVVIVHKSILELIVQELEPDIFLQNVKLDFMKRIRVLLVKIKNVKNIPFVTNMLYLPVTILLIPYVAHVTNVQLERLELLNVIAHLIHYVEIVVCV